MAPVKLAIVGGGPSAFYVASRLLSLLPHSDPNSPFLRIHMYDRLWAPHGLVRYGVAPDHPEVKNCTHKFDETAADPRLRFFGNVNIGNTQSPIPNALALPLSTLQDHYTHLLFAQGCTLPKLHPSITPSALCIPALSFVHWYTHHPSNPSPPPLDKISHLTLIGNGNVSLDVARILLTSPSVLQQYDVPKPVLDVLARSAVKHISIVGRRGPLEAAFTTKELREMMNLPEASMMPIDPSLLCVSSDSKLTRQQTRIRELLQKGSKNPPGSTARTWSLDFFRSPIGLVHLSPPPFSSLAQVTLAHTSLDPTSNAAVATGETSTLSTSCVVPSLGFLAEPEAPFYDPALGHLRSLAGRIISVSGTTLKNVYASGWAANGARGVLASTMIDAYAVADTILSDIVPGNDAIQTTPASSPVDLSVSQMVLNSSPHPENPPPEIQDGLTAGNIIEYEQWKLIDAEEVRRGQAMGKERERMTWQEVRAFLSQAV